MTTQTLSIERSSIWRNPGIMASTALTVALLAIALSLDFPKTAQGYKGDEATYYSLTHSLARDFDFAFEHKDLVRVWEEFPGPEGIFLKRGKVIDLQKSARFPYVRWVTNEDPVRTRLYYGKSYIYPLVAAPFVFFLGTNGFLVLHALLLGLDLFVAYLFLRARGSSPGASLAYAGAFLLAAVVPVYFVWMAPELFNFSLTLYALFFWSYKEVGGDQSIAQGGYLLRGVSSDVLAAALVGVLTFSKPLHAILICPLLALVAGRRQWRRVIVVGIMWVLVTGGLFLLNAAITGEFNYQGGDRKTFYGRTGFPFANERETFENIGPVRGRESLMVGDVLVNQHTFTVFRHNLVYFVFGRYSGLLPYFFPGVLTAALFLVSRRRQPWQWLVAATIVGAILMLILLTPFTYSGGGAPVGNRYFLSFYPLFLFLTPPLSTLVPAAAAFTIGALFTAKIVSNPFYSSFNPGEHAKSGPLRLLPIELTLLNDLPMVAEPDRWKQLLGGTPPVLAYFPDDNAYTPEGDRFWVKGKSRADVILRAPVVAVAHDRYVTKGITRLNVEIQNGGAVNRVTVSTNRESRTLDMDPSEVRHLTLAIGSGVPYRRIEQPTSYVYTVSIRATAGFVPFLEVAETSDSRFLGAMIRLVPEYIDRETSTWAVPPGNEP